MIRFVSSTEKRERSDACAQTQQCDHGIDVVGEKQSKSFSEKFSRAHVPSWNVLHISIAISVALSLILQGRS